MKTVTSFTGHDRYVFDTEKCVFDPANDPDFLAFGRVIRQARKRIADTIAKLED